MKYIIITFFCLCGVSLSELIPLDSLLDKEKGIIIDVKTGDLYQVDQFMTPRSNLRGLENEEATTETYGGEKKLTNDDSKFYIWIGISIMLTLFAGLMSGLTVGYLSIDDLTMEIKLKSGSVKEIKAAKRVLPILQRHHWLLVTLLLANAAAMEALPLFLDALMPAVMAVIISVTAVLFFGEIIPQAVCTGPDQIQIAAKVAPLTKGLMFLLSPIAYPISLCLDCCLGKHHKPRFENKDLKELITLHSKEELIRENLEVNNKELGLDSSQTDLMISAIDIQDQKVDSVYVNRMHLYSLDASTPYTEQLAREIQQSGFSRIPIYLNEDSNMIVGILISKNLLSARFDTQKCIGDFTDQLARPLVVSPKTPLLTVLTHFQKGFCHFAVVTEDKERLERLIDEFQSKEVSINGSMSGNSSNTQMGSWEWSGSVGGSTERFKMHSQVNRNYSDIFYSASSDRIKILGFLTMEDILERMFNRQDQQQSNRQIYDESDTEMLSNRSILRSDYTSSMSDQIEESQLLSPDRKPYSPHKGSTKTGIKSILIHENPKRYKASRDSLKESLLKERLSDMDESKGEEIMLTEMRSLEKKKKREKKDGLVSIKGFAPPHYTALKPHPIDSDSHSVNKL